MTVSTPPSDADLIYRTLRALGARLLVRNWLSANNVVFPGSGEGAAIVDTGYVAHAAQTQALVEHVLDGLPLARVLNTHLHSDHCGGNAALLRRWPKAQVSVPQGYAARVQPFDAQRLGYPDCDQRCEPFEVHGFLQPGTTVRLGERDWEVHAAPGHDPDAVVLFEPRSRTLVSGDALWEQRLAIIFPALLGDTDGFGAAQAALDRIERLDARVVLPGHGPAFTGVAAALAASRQRLDAFAADPARHHQYAVRALVSYHLLEHRVRERAALQEWIVHVPILRQAFGEAGPEQAYRSAEEAVQRLLRDGVLREDGSRVTLAA